MSISLLAIYILKFFIPALFSVLFRAFGLGYKSKKRLAIGLVAFLVYMIVVPSFLIIFMGYGQFTHVSTVVMTVASMSVLLFTTDSPGKTMFIQLIQGNVTTAISVILNMVRHMFNLSYFVLDVMLLVACPIVYVIALRFWAKPLRFISDNIHSNIAAHLALPIITMTVVYFIPVYPAQNFANHPFYCTVMMLAVELAFMLYIYTFYGNLSQICLLSNQQMTWKLVQSEIDSYHDYLESAKQSRHDLRHHNAVMLEYLKDKNIDGAVEYLNEQNKELVATSFHEYCKNPVANAIFRMYERRADSAKILFKVFAQIPKELPLTSPELGSVLSNILENAYEACEKSELPHRHIALNASTDEQRLLIELRNTVFAQTEFRDGMPVSTKDNGGTGSQSVKSIVMKHHGMVEYSQCQSEFFTRIILPLYEK